MTENRRIFWNIIATYGRSLYSLALGLFTARWALNALGVSDYGLYGVVGGLTAFISFLNSTLAGANSRFYAISIGMARAAEDKADALEECRRWFNTAFSIHTAVPIALVLIGYPIGAWAIRNFLTIPPDRVADCIWVFRFTCLTCFVGMMNVPFSAMYGAKQYIAELTIYSYFTATANAFFLYYMITHPGVWLLKYALWTSALSVVPSLIICIRAICIFPECRIRRRYLWDMVRIREVGAFGWWNLLGTTCALLRVQGVNILINKSFGATVNAAMSLGSSVNGHCAALTSSLLGAFAPAVTTAYGAGETERMKNLAYRMCKFGSILLLIFLIPLLSELQMVMVIWLKNPPPYATYLCAVMLIQTLLEVVTHGHMVAVNASGRIKEYQLSMVKISILTLPAAIVTVWLGGGVYAVGIVLICARMGISLRRVYYARIFAGLSAWTWLRGVVLPLAFVILVAGSASLVPRLIMAPSFGRIVVTTIFCELILLPMLWFVILDDDERKFVRERFLNRILSKIGLLRGDGICA